MNTISYPHETRSYFGPYFHLSAFQGIVMSPEVIPVHPISIRGVWSTKVLSVQIGTVTSVVPPSALVQHSALTWIVVVVLILSGKLQTTVREDKTWLATNCRSDGGFCGKLKFWFCSQEENRNVRQDSGIWQNTPFSLWQDILLPALTMAKWLNS